MFDCSDPSLGGARVAPLYFVSFVVIAQFVMLNLFIMIIVEDFEAADRRDKNMTPLDVAVRVTPLLAPPPPATPFPSIVHPRSPTPALVVIA